MKEFVRSFLSKFICDPCARGLGGIPRGGSTCMETTEGLCQRCSRIKMVSVAREYSWPAEYLS